MVSFREMATGHRMIWSASGDFQIGQKSPPGVQVLRAINGDFHFVVRNEGGVVASADVKAEQMAGLAIAIATSGIVGGASIEARVAAAQQVLEGTPYRVSTRIEPGEADEEEAR